MGNEPISASWGEISGRGIYCDPWMGMDSNKRLTRFGRNQRIDKLTNRRVDSRFSEVLTPTKSPQHDGNMGLKEQEKRRIFCIICILLQLIGNFQMMLMCHNLYDSRTPSPSVSLSTWIKIDSQPLRKRVTRSLACFPPENSVKWTDGMMFFLIFKNQRSLEYPTR